MNRVPIVGIRKPITVDAPSDTTGLRKPIVFENELEWYDVWKFEGIYEINLLGHIRKKSTGEYLTVYNKTKKFEVVILRHPDGDGSSMCCNLIDVYTSTFLQDRALCQYSYINTIKRGKQG